MTQATTVTSGTIDTGPPGPPAMPQTLEWVADVDKIKKEVNSTEKEEEEEEMVKSASMEPSTLQWSENKPEPQILPPKDGETRSIESDCTSQRGGVSRTESEREEFGLREKEKTGERWREMETENERVSDTVLRNRVKSTCSEIEVEEVNIMPKNAARVFSPSITILRSTSQQEAADRWRDEEERSPFLGGHGTHGTPLEEYYQDWPIEHESRCCSCGGSNRDALKLGASMFTSALIFPLLVWGGYVFLPFDAPLLDSAPLRLVYTLRCSVFAVIPIVLGMLVLGVSRLWYRSLKPRFEGEREKLSRLLYWVAAACDSSLRGVGFGFSFLPMLVMLVANLYFIFLSESGGSIFAPDVPDAPVPPSKQRFWG
ncbi:Transmembrane protein 79 [Labeo rohita]|uniref:Transmembrane protein 79 n=1 Tax=Labeo rohita TaxID=84645 RepID=A0ABQ8LWY4_LABRO|nr:Transmembrane protein 79 [Labeo rohita]